MNNTDKLKLTQNIALIAGIFCITVALLLLLNFIQVKNSNPIESKALQSLVNRLKQEPNNDELKVEIRNFDLLARKAYFNSQWQVKTGTYLLLFGAIVLAIALRFYFSIKAKIEKPDSSLENEIVGRILAQKGIIIVGSALFLLSLLASFLTVNHLKYYDLEASKQSVTKKTDEGIKVIQVGENPLVINAITDSLKADTLLAKTVQAVPGAVQDSLVQKKDSIDNKPVTLGEIQKNHNSFRGPLGQGVVYHKNIPTKWDGAAGTNVLWKVTVPKRGFNSPIIWGDKLFVAGADNTGCEVYCYNRYGGKLLWTGKADNIQGSPASPPKVTEDTGLSASTLTTDGKRVYAIFATGDVIAFDMDGNRVWARNLGVPDNHYGHSSSLITFLYNLTPIKEGKFLLLML
jgi:outer membrane protein assembly factor BamB